MKNTGILLALLFVAVVGCKSESQLFNGKDLEGWQVYGTEQWYVEEGLLVAQSGPDAEYGYLATEENYKNFFENLEEESIKRFKRSYDKFTKRIEDYKKELI